MKLDEFRVLKTELDEKIATHGKDAVLKEFKLFFEKYPDIAAVRWTQYTPHFNDGDECTFSRHDFQVSLEFINSLNGNTEYENDDWIYHYSSKVAAGSNINRALEHLEETFSGTDDVFQSSFGDGYQITADRNGFTVETYDHD